MAALPIMNIFFGGIGIQHRKYLTFLWLLPSINAVLVMQREGGSVAALCCNDVIETDRYCIFLVFFNRKILVIASFW